MKQFSNFSQAIARARSDLLQLGYRVESVRWQGVDTSKKPEMQMHELYNFFFSVPTIRKELDHWRQDIKPNLPWADEHFEKERVSGHPINPGETWKTWPFGQSAQHFLDGHQQFNHSYAERYWPRRAGFNKASGGHLPPGVAEGISHYDENFGIRYRYADLNDLIDQLIKDPNTRQAYLPVWFPEDGSHFDRKPCSLGYHFMHRRGYMHVNYYIRSCDIVRHFQDDIYLTVRLLLWLLEQLQQRDSNWSKVLPGQFTMAISSLHCFVNDLKGLGDTTFITRL